MMISRHYKIVIGESLKIKNEIREIQFTYN